MQIADFSFLVQAPIFIMFMRHNVVIFCFLFYYIVSYLSVQVGIKPKMTFLF